MGSTHAKGLTLHLKVWRQKNNKEKGRMEDYTIEDVSTDASFLEMLDVLNEQLVAKGVDPVAFDHDCREGICGMCSLMIKCSIFKTCSLKLFMISLALFNLFFLVSIYVKVINIL